MCRCQAWWNLISWKWLNLYEGKSSRNSGVDAPFMTSLGFPIIVCLISLVKQCLQTELKKIFNRRNSYFLMHPFVSMIFIYQVSQPLVTDFLKIICFTVTKKQWQKVAQRNVQRHPKNAELFKKKYKNQVKSSNFAVLHSTNKVIELTNVNFAGRCDVVCPNVPRF